MYLELENICGFKTAKVHIAGITVIAGNNNTGKSTIGKSLLLMFQSLHGLEQKIINDKIYGMEDALDMLFRTTRHSIDTAQFANFIYNTHDFSETDTSLKNLIRENIESFFRGKEGDVFKNIAKNDIDGAVKQIIDTFKRKDQIYVERFFNTNTQEIFKGFIANNKSHEKHSTINLIVKDTKIKCNFKNGDVFGIKNSRDFYTRAIYIDNPFVIDDLNSYVGMPYTRNWFKRKIYNNTKYCLLKALMEEQETNVSIMELKEEGLQGILEQLKSLKIGSLIHTKNGVQYKYNGDHELPISNISTGLKVFLIIKTLLLNNSLQKNGTLILDEPEIHLHPEWQLVFAEILVLLQKTFGLHILLTTHSPYFLNAIETFAKKHAVQEKCHYYMTDCKDSYCTIEEVTENTKVIYKKFFDPFQALERIASNVE